MRFEDIVLEELELNNDGGGDYAIPATDDLVDAMNNIRRRQGNTDLVGCDYDNDVYYSFYLSFNGNTKDLHLMGECSHGEKDDFVWYHIEMTGDERNLLMWKLIKQLTKDCMEV